MKMMMTCLLATVMMVSAADFNEGASQALRSAVDAAVADAVSAGVFETAPIALLPIRGDRDGYVAGMLLGELTKAGFNCVEAKNSPFWDEIMKEVEWDTRKADMLDGATISAFGKLKSAKALVYGTLRRVEGDRNPAYAEIELHMSAIETKAHLWGGLFGKRFYKPGAVVGLTSIDEDVRDALGQIVEKGMESLSQKAGLKSLASIALVKLPGDLDGYVGNRVRDMLAKAGLAAKELDLATLGQARLMLRDAPDRAAALLHGSVRDLSKALKEELPLKKIYDVRAEVQLVIEDAKTGNVLWSDTLSAVTQAEDTVSAQSKIWQIIRQPKVALGIVGGIVVLIVLVKMGRAMTRVR